MKDLPIGNDNFRKIRDNDGYYVDKTELISEIVQRRNIEAFLFTRPRRFGKSLNMSMLDAFFNIQYKGNSWFDGLHVMNNDECIGFMNSYPVLFLNLKGLNVDDMDSFLKAFAYKISDVCAMHRCILGSDIDDVRLGRFDRIRKGEGNRADLENSIKLLTDVLYEYYGSKTIVIIDEYDNPVQSTYGMEIQSEIISFIRNLLTNGLKSNPSLEFGVITGVMQIAKESIFSGLNNLYVNNIFDSNFDECFGFTEHDVRSMLSYYGHPDRFDECKAWYDGYVFGNAEVYNPWSILNYIARGFKLDTYWAGTSGNDIIQTLLNNADESVWNDLNSLSKREAVECDLTQYISYSDIEHDYRAIYSIMAMSGYVKARKTEYGYKVGIPNDEMFQIYSDMVLRVIGSNGIGSQVSNLFKALQNGDVKYLETGIHGLIKETISAKVLDNEHVYQAYLIGMMMGFCGNYEIYGDRMETGDGFADVIFKRIRGPGPNIIIELKKSKFENDLAKDAESAMKQIMDRDYMHGFRGRTLLYGVSFFSKRPYIISREWVGS